MLKFILRRTLIMIPQLFLLSLIVFVLAKAMPGDAITGAFAGDPNATEERKEELREKFGLNDPWYEQYGRWIGNAVQGDFGSSYMYKQPVTTLLAGKVGNTVLLALFTLIITYIIAIPLGIVAGRWTDTWADKLIVTYNYFSFATPLFVFSLLMLFLFSFILGWFPIGGSVDIKIEEGTWDYIVSKMEHLFLPVMSGALLATFGTIQYLRNDIIDTKLKDFVKTARAKGVPERKVYTKHILRNSLLPIAAFLGYEIAGLIGGSIFIESIFSYPGLGQLFLTSIGARDFTVVTALVMILGTATIIGTMLSDIILSIVDPRIRVE
ncbi:oligopeptide ABC transporter permease [Sporosarcina limicola]|uniref:Peptide/nickel transport system permease protein n=1 Tax=Sporosarcina limicola TaxID=34101 RepID=A0A927R328_9BACL|nr:oligopeptide ABC transporter permease [Sporosarcina limicola]MBE1553301.1 peptide/nickel transport system permease protein [Sporosarcina limicola]MBE1553308.1 peptide/nickel transport system permease protein [Sporosarcina limicola]